MRLVVPRLGTISPWSSKATDIAAPLRPGRGAPHRAGNRVVFRGRSGPGRRSCVGRSS